MSRAGAGAGGPPSRPEKGQANTSSVPPRPVDVCRALLDALDATEGRRRRRKRNTSADAIGIGMKRALLEGALHDDPDPDAFEGWLLERCFEQGAGEGAWRAMALEIFAEWRMAAAAPSFQAWLAAGAPSDDKAERGGAGGREGRLPVLALAALLAGGVAVAGCERGIEADVEDVPQIEVDALSGEARQRTGMTAEVLGHLIAGPGPGSTVYDAPVDLAHPPGATVWPPATGTHGDEAAGAATPDTVDATSGDGAPVGPSDADPGPGPGAAEAGGAPSPDSAAG